MNEKQGAGNPSGHSASGRVIAVIDLGDFACQPSARYGHEPFGMRCLAGRRVFERMVERLSHCQRIDEVHLVGSNVPAHLVQSCPPNVKTGMLPSVHLIQRVAAAVDAADAEWCVYFPANEPFVDADLVDGLLAETGDTDCDFIGYRGRLGVDHTINLGLTGEVFHGDAIRRLRRNLDALPQMDNQSIVAGLDDAPGAYHLKFIPLPTSLDRENLRFAIRNDDDWDQARATCKSLASERFGYHDLLDTNRDL